MMGRSLLIIVGLIALVTCLSCTEQAKATQKAQQRIEQAKAEAEKFFVAFSIPGSETSSSWGMSDFSIFGRDVLMGIDMAAGQTNATKVADAPETFLVIIPFWVEGKNLDGEPLKLSRQLHITLIETKDELKWEIQGYEFREDKPLTFWRQLFSWLFWTFVGPVLVFLWLGSVLSDWSGSFGCSRIVAGIIALPFAGYSAFVCFGSVIAVIIGLAAYIVMLSPIIAFVSKTRRT